MARLGEQERFEEAADLRDRLSALVGALARARQERWLVAAEHLELEVDGRRLRFRRGALVRRGDEPGFSLPLSLEAVDEVRAALSCLRAARVVRAEPAPAEPLDGGAALADLRRRLEASRR
jgi:hypothetical protein